jgi:predicted small secreted protein
MEVTNMKKLVLSALLLTVSFTFTGCSPQDMQGHSEGHAHHVASEDAK